jgi:hypothetical protein
MRVIKTYNINSKVVEDLNDNVRRRYRSKWVEDAIKEKLKRKTDFDLHDIPTWEILGHVETFRWTKLTKAERAVIRDIVDRLREAGD